MANPEGNNVLVGCQVLHTFAKFMSAVWYWFKAGSAAKSYLLQLDLTVFDRKIKAIM